MKRNWLITGVSSGFGFEMTKQLLEKGDTVIGTVRNKEKVKDFIENYSNTFDCVILDVTDDEINHVVATNLMGSIHLLKASVPYNEKTGRWQTYTDVIIRRTGRICRKLNVPRDKIRH